MSVAATAATTKARVFAFGQKHGVTLAIRAVLAAAGHNLRLLRAGLARLLALLLSLLHLAAAAVVGMLRVEQASAQSTTMLSNTELSKEAENPVTLHVTLPLRYEGLFDDGPYRATKSTYEIDQAVVPFVLNDDWALITRSKLPAYSQPPKKKGDSWAAGFGNGYTTFFLSPTRGPGIYWGVGPVLFYPTATNAALGVNKWGSGVSAAVVKKDESPWEAGAVINNIWSLGGPPGSSDRYNQMLLNPFLSYHFGDGWSIGTSPNITANWLSKAGQVWTVPVGGELGKVFRIGTLPAAVLARILLQCGPAECEQRDLAGAGHGYSHSRTIGVAVEDMLNQRLRAAAKKKCRMNGSNARQVPVGPGA